MPYNKKYNKYKKRKRSMTIVTAGHVYGVRTPAMARTRKPWRKWRNPKNDPNKLPRIPKRRRQRKTRKPTNPVYRRQRPGTDPFTRIRNAPKLPWYTKVGIAATSGNFMVDMLLSSLKFL